LSGVGRTIPETNSAETSTRADQRLEKRLDERHLVIAGPMTVK